MCGMYGGFTARLKEEEEEFDSDYEEKFFSASIPAPEIDNSFVTEMSFSQ